MISVVRAVAHTAAYTVALRTDRARLLDVGSDPNGSNAHFGRPGMGGRSVASPSFGVAVG